MVLTDMRTPLSVDTFTHTDARERGLRLSRVRSRSGKGPAHQRNGSSSGSRVTSAPRPCMLSAKPA